jgi:hypothetical protein
VVNFIRPDVPDYFRNDPRVRKVTVMKKQARIGFMRVYVYVIYALRIECAGPPDDAMYFVSLAEQKLRQVTAVLASDAGNEGCFFHFTFLSKLAFPSFNVL